MKVKYTDTDTDTMACERHWIGEISNKRFYKTINVTSDHFPNSNLKILEQKLPHVSETFWGGFTSLWCSDTPSELLFRISWFCTSVPSWSRPFSKQSCECYANRSFYTSIPHEYLGLPNQPSFPPQPGLHFPRFSPLSNGFSHFLLGKIEILWVVVFFWCLKIWSCFM